MAESVIVDVVVVGSITTDTMEELMRPDSISFVRHMYTGEDKKR
jgi:hypothetical protein